MEGSDEILLSSLKSFGISIPGEVGSVSDLTPAVLVSICRQSLHLLDQSGESSPASVSDSDSMAEKFKICTDISLAFKNLGYIGDLSYHKFLYPSEEDLYKFARFLVERFSESSERLTVSGGKVATAKLGAQEQNFQRISGDEQRNIDSEGVDLNLLKVEAILKDIRLNTELPELSNSEAESAFLIGSHKLLDIPQNLDDLAASDNASSFEEENFFKNDLFSVVSRKDSCADSGESQTNASPEVADQQDDRHDSVFGKKANSHLEQSSKTQYEAETSEKREKVLEEELNARTLELQLLEGEFQLLKAAADMAFDQSHPFEFYLELLSEQANDKSHDIAELESQWNAFRNPLEEKKRSLENSLYASNPVAQRKLQKLREVELEIQSISSEIRRREEEHSKLSADVKKQPKVATRRSYIERVKEITKNSRKLDTDIERIVKDTRELQLESNSIQERLHRTYAVVDEIVFREAKKDQVGRQAYRLLTSMHESFEQISEKILATDRVRREIADLAKKLSAMACQRVNVDKLQADLDAIKKENKSFEQHLST